MRTKGIKLRTILVAYSVHVNGVVCECLLRNRKLLVKRKSWRQFGLLFQFADRSLARRAERILRVLLARSACCVTSTKLPKLTKPNQTHSVLSGIQLYGCAPAKRVRGKRRKFAQVSNVRHCCYCVTSREPERFEQFRLFRRLADVVTSGNSCAIASVANRSSCALFTSARRTSRAYLSVR